VLTGRKLVRSPPEKWTSVASETTYKACPHAILVTVVAGANIDERARHVVATIETGRVVTILNKLHVLLLDL
jgi:uncharacterized membrane protein